MNSNSRFWKTFLKAWDNSPSDSDAFKNFFVLLRSILLFLILGFTFGCASWSNRTKTLAVMAGTGILFGTIGACHSPKNEKEFAHATLWGAPAAALAAGVGLFVFDEESRSRELERQTSVLKKELQVFQNSFSGGGSDPELLLEVSTQSGKELPSSVSHLVKPGKWQLYQLNQWKSVGDHTLVHEDQMFKLIPPHLHMGESKADYTELHREGIPNRSQTETVLLKASQKENENHE